MPPSEKHNLYLVGMPGSGKSTIGKALARKLKLPFVDADHEMLQHTGVSIATIFELEGEAGFRAREAQLMGELCRREGILLATGGGAVLREENRRALRQTGVVVYLHASLDHLWQRTRHDSRRPLLQADNPREILKALLETRDPLYRQTANVVVETGRQSASKLVHDIAEELARRQLWPPAEPAPEASTNTTTT
ncbi:MAG: shikimate kinase [Betaproteobacteria bacterium]|nr:shikimate kinase [Betaproteobacteria bacterium]